MPIYDVTVEGKTYEVDAPDERTAWGWANYTHRQKQAEKPKTKESTVGSEAVRGFKQLLSTSRTGIGALTSPEEAAKAGVERSQQIAAEAGEGPSLAAVRKAYEERGLLPAAGEVLSQIPRAIAGQGAQLAAMAGGAKLGAMAGTAVAPGVGTIAGGVLGAGATLLPQFFGANVERQAAEQMQRNEPISIDRGTAAAAAAAQAGIESAGTALVLGKRVVKGILGVTDDAALATAKAREELVKAAARSRSGAALRGAAVGLAEIPVEVAQAVIERAQAGLDVMSPEALSEYGENAYLAGLIGPTISAATRVTEPGAARKKLAAEEQAKKAEARAVAAKAEEEKKKDPEYALKLDADYQAAVARMKELQAAVPKKPGKDALPEEQIAYKEAKAARDKHLKEVLQPLAAEYVPRKAEIAQLKEQQRVAGMTPLDYQMEQLGVTFPETKPEAAPEAPRVFTGEEEITPPLPREVQYAQQQIELAKRQDMGTFTEADYVQYLMQDPVMAQKLVDSKAPIPGVDKKTSNAILGGLKLQLKDRAKATEAALQEDLSQQQVDLAAQQKQVQTDAADLWKASLEETEEQATEELLRPNLETIRPTGPATVTVPSGITPIQNPGTLLRRIDDLLAARDKAAADADTAFAAGNRELGAKKAQEREVAQTQLNDLGQTEGPGQTIVGLRKAQDTALMNAVQLADDLKSGRTLGAKTTAAEELAASLKNANWVGIIGSIKGPARPDADNESISVDEAKLLRQMVVKTILDGVVKGKSREQIIAQIEGLTKGGISNSGMARINQLLSPLDEAKDLRGTASSTPQTLINQINKQRDAFITAAVQEAAATRRLFGKSVTQAEAEATAKEMRRVFDEWVTRSMAQPVTAVNWVDRLLARIQAEQAVAGKDLKNAAWVQTMKQDFIRAQTAEALAQLLGRQRMKEIAKGTAELKGATTELPADTRRAVESKASADFDKLLKSAQEKALAQSTDPRPLEERRFGAYRAAVKVLQEQLQKLSARLSEVPKEGRRVESTLKMQYAPAEAQRTAEARGETATTLEGELRRRRNYIDELIDRTLQSRPDLPDAVAEGLRRVQEAIQEKRGGRDVLTQVSAEGKAGPAPFVAGLLDSAEQLAQRALLGRTDVVTGGVKGAREQQGYDALVYQRNEVNRLFQKQQQLVDSGVNAEGKKFTKLQAQQAQARLDSLETQLRNLNNRVSGVARPTVEPVRVAQGSLTPEDAKLLREIDEALRLLLPAEDTPSKQLSLFPAEKQMSLAFERATPRNFANAPIVKRARAAAKRATELLNDIKTAWDAADKANEKVRASKIKKAEEDVEARREDYRNAFNAALEKAKIAEITAKFQPQIDAVLNQLALFGKEKAKALRAKETVAAKDLEIIMQVEREALQKLREELAEALKTPSKSVEPAEMPKGAVSQVRGFTQAYELQAAADEWVEFERERLAKAEAKLEKLKGPERQAAAKEVNKQRSALAAAENTTKQNLARVQQGLGLPGIRVERQAQTAAIADLEERIPNIKDAGKKAKAMLRLAKLKVSSGKKVVGAPDASVVEALRSKLAEVKADTTLTKKNKQTRIKSLETQISALEARRGEAIRVSGITAAERAQIVRDEAEASRVEKAQRDTELEQRILDLGTELADKEGQLERAKTDESKSRLRSEIDAIKKEAALAEAELGTTPLTRTEKRREYKRRSSLFSGRGGGSEKELLATIAQKLEDKKPLTAYEKKVWETRNQPKTKLSKEGKKTYFEAAEALRREREEAVQVSGTFGRDEVIDIGGIKFSRGPTAEPSTTASVRSELGKVFPDLGRVQIYDSVEALIAANPQYKGKIPADARGFVDTAGNKAFLIAENIDKGNALSVLLHEVGAHIGLKKLVGEAQYKTLVKAVESWEKRKDSSIESRVADAARQRVKDAETPANQVDDELLAYAIEEAVKAGVQPMKTKGPIGQWLSQIGTLFRKALQKFGLSPKALDAQSLVDMAFGAAQMEMAGEAKAAPKQVAPASDFIVGKQTAFLKGAKGEEPRASAGLKQLTEDDDAYDDVGNATFITGMNVAERGKGLGTTLLNRLLDWADTNNKRLALVPAAASDRLLGGLTQQQLKDWYSRNGFKPVGDYMVREPVKAPDEAPSSVGDILFSRKPTYSDDLAEAGRIADKLVPKSKTFIEKIANNLGLNFRTQYVDSVAPTEEALRAGVEGGSIEAFEASQAMYYIRSWQHRMNMVAQAIGVGAPALRKIKRADGADEYVIEAEESAKIKDVVDVLADKKVVKAAGSADAANRLFTLFLAAIRADRVGYDKLNFGRDAAEKELQQIDAELKRPNISDVDVKRIQQRREYLRKNMDSMPSEAEIKAARSAIENDPVLKEAFGKARDIYNDYNRNLVRFAVQSGYLSKETADRLLKDNDYVPYYRIRGGVAEMIIGSETPIRIGNLKDSPYLDELIGGEEPIMDFLNSSVQNTSMLLDMSMKNLAQKEAMWALAKSGLATIHKAGKSGAPKGAVEFKKNGEDWYAIVDTDHVGIPSELLTKGLAGIPTMLPAGIRWMGLPARILRRAITASPVYMLRQLIRDSTGAFLGSGSNAAPVLGTLKQLRKAGALERRGVTGGQMFTGMPEDVARLLSEMQSGRPGWARAFSKLEAMSMEVDAATRRSQYESYLSQGLSEMEATLASIESMNFLRRGVSPGVHWASTLIPFLNAQIQSMDTLYRALSGKMPFNEQLKIREKLFTRGALLATAAVAYAMAMEDEEEYKNARPTEKYNNFFVRLPFLDDMAGERVTVRVPIPFEIGYIFKSLPEAIYNTVTTEHGGEEAAEAFYEIGRNLIPGGSSYGMPAAIKPLIEVGLGKSFFTGRDIESAREQEVQAGLRYRDNTTNAAKFVGEMLNVSPIKLEFLINGYTGSMGMALLGALNPIVPGGETEKATKRLADLAVVGSLFQPADATGIIDATYEALKDATEAQATYKELVRKGEIQKANAYIANTVDELTLAGLAGKYKQYMGDLTKAETAVRGSRMSDKEKREALDKIRAAKIQVANAVRGALDKTKRPASPA